MAGTIHQERVIISLDYPYSLLHNPTLSAPPPAHMKQNRRILIGSFLLAHGIFASQGVAHAAADLVIVANPASGIERLSREEVTAIYMGRSKKLPSGITALPIDQAASNPAKARFYGEITHKGLPEINSYWARLIFSGQGSPPRQADNSAEVLEIVGSNKGAIGYVPKASVDKRVRIVLDLSEP